MQTTLSTIIPGDDDPTKPTLIGTVINFPRRRAVHPRLFFLELQEKSDSAAQHQILFKHGKGGHYQDANELEALRRDVRHGDTLQVKVGHQEMLNGTGEILWHATSARIVAMHIHGNTGSSYQREITDPDRGQGCNTLGSGVVNAGGGGGDVLGNGNKRAEIDIDGTGATEVHLPSKKERFAVFCEFLVAQVFPALQQHDGSNDNSQLVVYDIAGGRGELALLLTLAGYRVVLVDPRDNAGMLSSRSRKQMRKSGKEPFEVKRVFFDAEGSILRLHQKQPDIQGSHDRLLPGEAHNQPDNKAAMDPGEDSSPDTINPSEINDSPTTSTFIVGLHPDEATEAIVDAALTHHLPFAVVPCCVYSRLFPHRRYQGKPVRTHEQFCGYLQSKSPGIERSILDFGGHATVLYHLGNY